uniref:Uncharacterized protein n=1 Tax=Anguilla anguilla TaxID=7936 RepID=A0A0E9Q0Z4_ANGAN
MPVVSCYTCLCCLKVTVLTGYVQEMGEK